VNLERRKNEAEFPASNARRQRFLVEGLRALGFGCSWQQLQARKQKGRLRGPAFSVGSVYNS
jgi:hypothetical protein